MKRHLLLCVALLALIGVATGCYSTVSGHQHAGVPFARDDIASRYERPPGEVLQAARDVLSQMGVLTVDNTINNTLTARVDQSTVWVGVQSLDTGLTQLTVQARSRGGVPYVDLASEVDKRIALRLATAPAR
jgi:hypothetical protein